MGGIQQRKCQIWLSIERNPKCSQKQLFDLSKQRTLVNSNKLLFPSYLHYYDQTKTLTYSLLEDYQNQFAVLDYNENANKQLYLTKIKRNHQEKIWKLLRQSQETQLEQGGFIKLGRIELEIKELRFTNNKKSIKNLLMQFEVENNTILQPIYNQQNIYSSSRLKNSDMISKQALSRMKESDLISNLPSDCYLKKSIFTQKSSCEVICRFCFDSSSTKNNPLFNVCLCAGSVKHIHFQCLKNWIKNKMGKVQTSHCIYYHYEPLSCQLCKHSISNQIVHEGRKYKLFQTEKMYPPYMKLSHQQDNKIFEIIIRLEEGSNISIGRGAQNELNLNDPSISRSHCSLYYTSHRLFLKGKRSKYGTFIELSKCMDLPEDQPIELLIQNNLISINKKSQSKGLLDQQCCNIESNYKLIVK